MVELEHARNILSELGLNTASELLDAKLEDSLHFRNRDTGKEAAQ